MNVTVVIPVYNEGQSIKRIVKNTLSVTNSVFVIDDNSTDGTRDILKNLPIRLFSNTTNIGYAKSLEKGIKEAFKGDADYVISMDGDGQHRLIDLIRLVYCVKRYKPDIAIGRRQNQNRLMEKVIGFYTKAKIGISDPLCGLKAYHKKIFAKYKQLETSYTIGTELCLRALKDGAKFREIAIKTKPRKDNSRFGNGLKGNWLELKAFINIIKILS